MLENQRMQILDFLFLGDSNNYQNGFQGTDYLAFINKAKYIHMLYLVDGALSCRTSNDSGNSWFDSFSTPIYLHLFSDSQITRDITNFGMTYDEKSNYFNISYISGGMLFIRKLEGNIFNIREQDEDKTFDFRARDSYPIFITRINAK